MAKIKQIKPVGKLKTTKIEATEQVTGFSVPVSYVENSITFSEEVATGSMEGRKYSVQLGHGGTLAVIIDDVAGQVPEFSVKFSDLILMAFEAAKAHQLFINKPKIKTLKPKA